VARAKESAKDEGVKDDPVQATASAETASTKEAAPQDIAESDGMDAKEPDGPRRDVPADDGKTADSAEAEAIEPTERRTRSRWVVVPALLAGGALAAITGYGAAQLMPHGWPIYDVPDPNIDLRATVDAHERDLSGLLVRVSEWDGTAEEVAESRDRLTELEAVLRDIESRLAASESRPSGVGVSPEALGALEDRLGGLAEWVGEIDARLAAFEARPSGGDVSREALVALEDRLAGLEGRVGEVEASGADREDAAMAVMRRAALSRIRAALDSGVGFAGALADLNEAGTTAVPPALADAAASGVATESALRNGFPEAARVALAAETEAAVAEGRMTRLSGFLRRQFGMRSVRPREGADADAILSRAEAALKEGDLVAGLEELRALPPTAAEAMRDWIVTAETRRDALEAAVRLDVAPDGG